MIIICTGKVKCTHEHYVRSTDPELLSPYSHIPGWHIYRNGDDILHDGYLGFLKDVTAQLMVDEAEDRLWRSHRISLTDMLCKLLLGNIQ